MEIEIFGRGGYEVDDEMRRRVHKRFERIGRQVSKHARLELVLREEANPSIVDSCIAEATLRLKRVTLRAEEASPDMGKSVKAVSLDMRRQVKRHRELRRKRSTTRRLVGRMRGRAA